MQENLPDSELYFDIRDDQWPIVYHRKYNVSFWGLEKYHAFDAGKWGNVIKNLKEAKLIDDEHIVEPNEAKKSDLLVVHTKKYLKSLKGAMVSRRLKSRAKASPTYQNFQKFLLYIEFLFWSAYVASIAELPCVACCPNVLVQKRYLYPMRLQTGGSVLAGKLALERGWAINVGGGFHHCCGYRGGGFCAYADITLMLRFLMMSGRVQRAMIVDLDAHQGNGYARDFINVEEVYIMDMYNKHIYPRDKEAKQAIRRNVELKSGTEDLEYMVKLRNNLKEALAEFTPDLVVYNAGTDVLHTDPLGHLNISEFGVIKRDEFVFESCKKRAIPIVMLTSGGYLRASARVISQSILNLHKKRLICQTKGEEGEREGAESEGQGGL